MTEILPTDKFTIVVNNEKSYSLFFRKSPISLVSGGTSTVS